MGWVLPKLTKTKSGASLARQAIPADVRDEYRSLYGKRREERWRGAPETPVAEQKRLYSEWVAEIAGRIAAIRAAKRGEGIDLSREDALALAGEWYSWFVARMKTPPASPNGGKRSCGP